MQESLKIGLHDFKGVIHVHSRQSDGSGNLEVIIAAAQRVGLDYVIITDHNTLSYKEREGWYGSTLLLVGEEISPCCNHYVALGIEKEVAPNEDNPGEYIEAVNDQGGVGFIVHPQSKRKRLLGIGGFPWQGWDSFAFNGMELWSYMYDWIELVNIFNLPYYVLRPDRAISGPDRGVIRAWDKLNQERCTVAISGVDVHARRVPLLPFICVFPYHYLFRTLRTHVVCLPFRHKLAEDKEILYTAIRKGHCYLAYDFLADASGFTFTGSSSKGILLMGDQFLWEPGITLTANLPCKARLKLLRHGRIVEEKEGESLTYNVGEAGVYRIEVYLNNRPWIYSNPIYLR